MEQPEAAAKLACYTARDLPEGGAGRCLRRLAEQGMETLYREIELPLVFVLDDMEKTGVRADGEALKAYGQELVGQIEKLEQSIYEKAGEAFNINSPKQLGAILF